MWCLCGTLASAQNWKGTSIDDAKGKTVYLWNVGAQKFLGKGGRWGTEAVITTVGTPFTLTKSGSQFYLTSKTQAEGGTDSGCLEFMNGVNSVHDKGNFFVDRNFVSENPTFLFTVSGSQTAYQLKVTSDAGSSSAYKGTFYMVADQTTGKAKGEKTVDTDAEAYSKWIIVTLDERKNYFKETEASTSSTAPATFLMYDQDFARNDMSINYWKTKSSSSATTFDGELKNGTVEVKPTDAYATKTYTHTYTGSYTILGVTKTVTETVTNNISGDEQKEKTPTITKTISGTFVNHKVELSYESTTATDVEGYTYYVGNGYGEGKILTEDEDGNSVEDETLQQELYGGDWTANIHGAYGVVNQTIKNENMVRKGWYKVSCVGFTTATTGKAQLYASAGTANEIGEGYQVKDLKAITDSPETYVKASRLINNGGNKYEASVMVYVGPKSGMDNTLKTISFGIHVEGADANAWTCFDNFQIDYLGDPTQAIVLDEDQTSVDYINKQASIHQDEKKTLYLHRTVNVNKWNSIVLPVSLTVGQVQSAFGDDIKLSQFKGAIDKNYPTRMYFEDVDVDRDNKNAIAIEAGKLYIMKPTKAEPTNQDEIKFPSETGLTTSLKSYFTIVGVNKNDGDVKATVKGETGSETFGGESQVQFVGTYVKGDQLIPANSYVLRGNSDANAGLWYYRTVKTKTKGFRGWLQVLNTTAAKDFEYSIDGEIYNATTTSIDELLDKLNGESVKGDVYDLGGRLVRSNATSLEGLPKGVYVVGGKKMIVK